MSEKSIVDMNHEFLGEGDFSTNEVKVSAEQVQEIEPNVEVQEVPTVKEMDEIQEMNDVQEVTKEETPISDQFVIKMKDPKELRMIAESVSTLVDEATFEVSIEGLTFRGMDPSHVALVDISVPNSCFDGFECSSTVKFGVRIDEFAKVLANLDPKEPVTIYNETGLLYIKSFGSTTTLRLIESTGGSTPLPKLNFNTTFELDKRNIQRLKNVEAVSEYVTIESDNNALRMSGQSDYGHNIQLFEPEHIMEIQTKENSKATYSLDYITKFTKSLLKYVKSLKFEYSTKMPMRISTKINNYGTGYIHFYLAPRVQE